MQRAPTPSEDHALRLEGQSVQYGEGCEHCRGTGYRGRTPLMEIMTVTEEIASLVGARASTAVLRAAAERAGLFSLRDAARTLVLAGTTTPVEALRETY